MVGNVSNFEYFFWNMFRGVLFFLGVIFKIWLNFWKFMFCSMVFVFLEGMFLRFVFLGYELIK